MIEIAIDWKGLYQAFQSSASEYRCFLSLDSGEVLRLRSGDAGMEAVDRSPSRFVAIEIVPSRIQYQWVSEFVDTVEYEPIKVRLEAAINGKGAFRRFKDILLTLPDERRRWFEFRDRRMRTRVREWIEENGIVPTNEPDWDDDVAEAENADRESNECSPEQLENEIKKWAGEMQPLASLTNDSVRTLAAELTKKFIVTSRS